MNRPLTLATLGALLPGAAFAHAFDTGRDAYGLFLEGTGVILATPALLLPLAALGVALALWKSEGMLAAWPALLIGMLAGFALAPLVPPTAALVPLAFGLVIGVLSALFPLERIAPAIPILAGLMGLAVIAAALEGHGFGEIGVLIRAGIFFAANAVVAVVAGAVRWITEHWPGEVTRIGGRIAASWLAAILVLYLAFAMAA
ncbi:hypothetical protein [Maritimibacter sp. DP1N21-5]|uniref:hypothetical protein n=1 Tax=Maritimibacter sp. DP1N21-5 TaxID=2836867 RepID=UPI001C4609BE|nr:hypothetical protein [Maritimibacter sp. DP1N21-5]MBV7409719.1 hypothetical protein [Maritimibacter sp. DP1N21-5]